VGLRFKQQQARTASGKEKLRLAGSTETRAGNTGDGSDGKFKACAEVKAGGAIGVDDGKAGLPGEVQGVGKEGPSGVIGPRGDGFRPEA
jgi:hypothetical protein